MKLKTRQLLLYIPTVTIALSLLTVFSVYTTVQKAKLLSLNTAIEASRSENKSFGVIADNISKLAETTNAHVEDEELSSTADELEQTAKKVKQSLEFFKI